MHALSLAIQMSYVKITSSSFLGLPVTNVSVFLPALLAAIIPRVGAYFSRRRTRGMIRALKRMLRELVGVLATFVAATVSLYALAASLLRNG